MAEGETVSGVKGRQRILCDAGVLAGESFADEFFQLGHGQIEHLGDQTERENIFPLILARAANGFHGSARDRDAQMAIV